jgi:hypothetical protein
VQDNVKRLAHEHDTGDLLAGIHRTFNELDQRYQAIHLTDSEACDEIGKKFDFFQSQLKLTPYYKGGLSLYELSFYPKLFSTLQELSKFPLFTYNLHESHLAVIHSNNSYLVSARAFSIVYIGFRLNPLQYYTCLLETVLHFYRQLIELHPEKKLRACDCLSPPNLCDATQEDLKDGAVSRNKKHQNALSKSFVVFSSDDMLGIDRVFNLLYKSERSNNFVLDNSKLICTPGVSTYDFQII